MNKKHLETKIEEQLETAWNSPNPIKREQAQKLGEFYALQYKELTGHYYVREAKR